MTYLGLTRSDRCVIWAGFPAAGAVLAWFAPLLARRIPDEFPWPWAIHLAETAPSWQAAIVGAVAGAALAGYAEYETPRIDITDDHIQIHRSGTTRTYRKQQIHHARLDGKYIVLEAGNGTELAREKPEGADRVQAALKQHGYV